MNQLLFERCRCSPVQTAIQEAEIGLTKISAVVSAGPAPAHGPAGRNVRVGRTGGLGGSVAGPRRQTQEAVEVLRVAFQAGGHLAVMHRGLEDVLAVSAGVFVDWHDCTYPRRFRYTSLAR